MQYIQHDPTTASITELARIARTVYLAQGSDMRQKHGAILYAGGRVIQVGVNTLRNTPRLGMPYDAISTHAEIAALSGIRKRDTNRSVLYVARITPGGNVASSEPCDRCKEFLEKFTLVKKVVFT